MATTMPIDGFPHCDSAVLHAPGECEYCDGRPEWQSLREAWGIAFTGHAPRASLPECGAKRSWGARDSWRCRQAAGHDKGERPTAHSPARERELLPCPADAARPPGSAADHRRWGGNKPTSAAGDPAWPAESAASVALYGDKGGRRPWPLPERVRARLARPLRERRMRRDGWRKENGWWRFP
jgi:hypothetical protein